MANFEYHLDGSAKNLAGDDFTRKLLEDSLLDTDPHPQKPYPAPNMPYPAPDKPYPAPDKPYPAPDKPYPAPDNPYPTDGSMK